MDILLHPVDARATIDNLVKAVEQGRLTEQRIHESVDRIMAAKKRLGLFAKRAPKAAKIDYDKHRTLAAKIAARALTAVRGEGKDIRFDREKGVACFVLDDDGQGMGIPFTRALLRRFGTVNSTTLTPDTCGTGTEQHLGPGTSGSVVIGIFSRISASKGRSGITPKLKDAAMEILKRAKVAGVPSAVISFDSPYILDQFKDADLLIAGYDRMEAIQEAAAEML